jgi:hypothetical protein
MMPSAAKDAKYLSQIVALQDEHKKIIDKTKQAMDKSKKAMDRKKKAMDEKHRALIRLAQLMKSTGASDDEIRGETGLNPSDYQML